MNEIPLVTVLLPVYNAEKFLEQAIRSVLDQTFTEFEFLIINDGSTDRSEEIIVSFNDSRIRYIKNETNLKLIKTLNKGIEFASGKYIARMDADDISLPTRFEQQVALLEKQPEIGVCGTNCIIFTTKGEESPSQYASDNDEIKFNMLRDCHFCHPSVMMRKSILENPPLRYNLNAPHSEDYRLWTELASRTNFYNLEAPLLKYRSHEKNISKLNYEIQSDKSVEIRDEYFKKLGITLNKTQLKTFTMFSYSDFSISYENVLDLVTLLNELATSSQKIISIEFLKKHLAKLWSHFTINSDLKAIQLGKLTRKLTFLTIEQQLRILSRITLKPILR